MKLLNQIKDSLKDVDALINIYQNEVIFNYDVNLIDVSDNSIYFFYHNLYVTITGDNLSITELTNITKIKGNIKKLLYEVK